MARRVVAPYGGRGELARSAGDTVFGDIEPYTRAHNVRPYETGAKVPEGGVFRREYQDCGGRADGDIGPYEI